MRNEDSPKTDLKPTASQLEQALTQAIPPFVKLKENGASLPEIVAAFQGWDAADADVIGNVVKKLVRNPVIEIRKSSGPRLTAGWPPRRTSIVLTLKEAAERLGYSESGLRKLIAKRAIKFAKPGGRYKFKLEWLEEFVAKGTVATQDEIVSPKPKRKYDPAGRHGFGSILFNV